jgi:hypothetical protein
MVNYPLPTVEPDVNINPNTDSILSPYENGGTTVLPNSVGVVGAHF